MATISFTYAPDTYDNEGITSANLIAARLEYSFDVPANVELRLEDLQDHFEAWLCGLGYHLD
jgi:hypothetical protein